MQKKLVHKLTDAHLKPNNFQKMHVGIAGSTLSDHMAIAINTYRTMDATTPEQKRIEELFKGILL